MDKKKERAIHTERTDKIDWLKENLRMQGEALFLENEEKLFKLKRDFDHVLEQLDYVEKRGGLVNPDGGDYPLKWMSQREDLE